MVEWAGAKPGMNVLEPSAGNGALLLPLLESGAVVTAIEADEKLGAHLFGSALIGGHKNLYEVRVVDFLRSTIEEGFDLVVANPPFDGGVYTDHVVHMLKLAPRVVTLLPLAALETKKRHERIWAENTLSRLAIMRSRFKAEGTKTSGQRPFAVFEILRGKHDAQTQVEWW